MSTYQVVKLSSTELIVSSLGENRVFSIGNRDDTDTQTRLSHVEDDNLLVPRFRLSGVTLFWASKQSSLLPLFVHTDSVSDQYGSSLVKHLNNVQASVGSGRPQCLDLLRAEPGRSRNDT
jgi:hypothetical protein